MYLKTSNISFPGLGIDEFEVNSNVIEIGKFSIAWYALIITIGILFALFYIWRRFKENGNKPDDLLDFAIAVIPSGILGARLYYIIFSLDYYIVTDKDGFFANLGSSLYRMIAIWNGGLAIYGAIIGGAIATFLMARHKKIPFLRVFDFLAPAVMMAQAIGRWGNFCNAEAYGGETSLPWRMGIRFGEVIKYVHPTFLYESLWNLVGFLIIHFVFVKKFKKFDGQIFYMYIAWYGFGRMFIEGLRSDSLYLGPFRISQVIGCVAFLVGTTMLIINYVKLSKKNKEAVPEEKTNNKKAKGKKNGKHH